MTLIKMLTLVVMATNLRSAVTAENRDDWIDPNDMLNFDPSTNTMKKDRVKIPDLKPKTTPTPPMKQEDDRKLMDEKDSVVGCPPCRECTQDCPPCVECTQDCPPCVECTQNWPPCESKSCPPCGEEEGSDRVFLKPRDCPKCQCEPQKECVCQQAAFPLLRQYIRTIMEHLGDQGPYEGTEDYTMHISLSRDQVLILQKFVTDGNQKHIHDVHDILSTMIARVVTLRIGQVEKMIMLFEEKIGLKLERLIQFVMLGALASVVLLIEIKLQIAWRRRITQMIVLMFLISVPWTWFELYKQAEIRQHSVATGPIPKECVTGEKDTMSELWIGFKSYFTLQDDKCHKYHEHLMIDPLVKVPPTKAIAVTFVRFFLAPLKDVGSAMSEFIRALLIDLPLTLYPVALVMVSMFFFMLLFMWFGYSIRLPFFLTIEKSPQLSVANSQLQQAIQDTSTKTLAQLEKLQARLESTETELAGRLKHMERVQQAAIEYTISSEPNRSPESPTLTRSEVNVRSESSLKSEVKVKYMPPVKSGVKSSPSLPVTVISAMSIPLDDTDNSETLQEGDTPVKSAINTKEIGAINRNETRDHDDSSDTLDNNKKSKLNGFETEIKQNHKIPVDTLKPDGTA